MKQARVPALTVAALAVFLVALVASARPAGNVRTGDTEELVAGAAVARDCLREGVWRGCGTADAPLYSSVRPFPLLQYLPAGALLGAGVDPDRVVDVLAALNLAAFFGILGCVAVLGRRALRGWAPVLLATMLGGPLLFYATAGFGEMLAAFTALAFLTLLLVGRPGAAGAVLALACLGKETAAPFLVALGLLCIAAAADSRPARRAAAAAVCTGGLAGVVLTAGFNVFRYGTLSNRFYLDDRYRLPGFGQGLDHLAGLWIAPTGGLAWFWPLALGLLVGGATLGLHRARIEGWAGRRGWYPLVGVVGVFAAFQLGLALWPFPFGWIAWGPRLTVPLVPVTVVALAFTGGAPLARARDRLTARTGVVAAAAALVAAAALPQAGVLWDYRAAITALVTPAPGCADLRFLPEPPDPVFYDCQHAVMWRATPSVLLAPTRPRGAVAPVAQAALAVALVGLVGLARPPRPPAPREAAGAVSSA